ncbi:IS66 family transposase [Paracoccus caeni]|uniref:IS66 family transposase n=1 Tax=Paracoccus caeni TaxID=657651 RepID=A0A934SC55_9RHOB|nr:IS66 family transposase [Paracoccus caeni]MBK4216170.1 IS66 family transposase [Paracoccus caeni]
MRADLEAALGQPVTKDLIDQVLVLVTKLGAEIRRLSARATHLSAELKAAKKALGKAKRMLFSPSADRDPTDDEPPNQTPDEGETTPDTSEKPVPGDNPASEVPKRKPSYTGGRGKKNWGDGVEYREVLHETPDKRCPCRCGGDFRGYDDHEVAEVEPARYYVVVHRYAKYRCRLQNRIVGTPFEQKIIRNTGMSTSFLAQLITLRFSWYLPWHRQQEIMRQQGMRFHRSTMARWTGRVAHSKLRPIYDLLMENLLSVSLRLFMDETPVDQLSPGSGKTKKIQMFALHRDDRSFSGNLPPGTAYLYRQTREMTHVHDALKDRQLIVHHDGHRIYGHLGEVGTPFEQIVSVDCWAHVRRLFMDEIKAEKAPHAKEIVTLIRELYAIESAINGKAPLVRASVRRKESRPVLDRIRNRLMELEKHYLGKSDMRKAIRYTLTRWIGLTRFVDHGRIELDNNPVERQFKHTILLRNNVLFIGSEEGGEAWAILASLAQTCNLNNIDFYRYLMWVFDEIIEKGEAVDYEALLPWNAPNSCRNDLPKGT